jgi:hypothetical protein
MALQHDLLEQAEHLARRELKRPRQASLRRAVSSAYYALFHLLVAEGARRFAPAQPAVLRLQFRRAFVHSDMRQVCERVIKRPLPTPLDALFVSSLEPELIAVARAFVALQEARHAADYDLTRSFDRTYALLMVQVARSAFANWQAVRSGLNATVFLAALLLSRHWR